MKLVRFLFLLWILSTGISCSDQDKNRTNITNRFEFFRDPTGQLSLEEVEKQTSWQNIQEDSLSFHFTKDIIWLRTSLKDPAFFPEKIISLEWKALDNAILFLPDETSYLSFQTGDSFPKSTWAVPEALDPSFKIPQGIRTKKKYIYLRLQSISLISFPIFSMDENAFHNKIVLETAVIYLILGFCAVMFLISLFYLVAFRLYEFFYYAVYILTTTLWFNTQFGNSFHSLWPNSTWWQSRSNLFFLALGIAASFQFVRMFLNTKQRTPWVDRGLTSFAFVGLISAFCIPFTETNMLFSRIINLIYLISVPIILLTGIRIYWMGDKKIKFFLFCWGSYLCSGYVSIFYYLGIIPYSLPILYGSIFIFPIDLFFLLFNLLQKYKDLDWERNEILHKFLTINNSKDKRYTKSKLESVNTVEFLVRLEKWMSKTKPYLDETLDLEKTSSAIGLNLQQTSELINSQLGMSFRAYLNSYRIKEAKEMLKNKPDFSVIAIAFATGFGSKSAFNAEFKKSTGLTPGEYRKKTEST
ncbi:AraC-like DNA-binding protein [Leptospira meyeri]|uniref:AraC-like DNA-binding protein n=1 Tax=Leptospira meyeri TaxID=29508 RepID=A0A4R8MK36_LEPME|nr:7TM diverse intracellular signaling domain-containing protein [Leptospira meyeri]EKJ86835.1 7TM diverse intracellular signaling [Leptospira meyeri serovar Hardjo str. Went 5]TDY67317.1 AraC-like DNA-binding protein [Leptospira meyeri]